MVWLQRSARTNGTIAGAKSTSVDAIPPGPDPRSEDGPYQRVMMTLVERESDLEVPSLTAVRPRGIHQTTTAVAESHTPSDIVARATLILQNDHHQEGQGARKQVVEDGTAEKGSPASNPTPPLPNAILKPIVSPGLDHLLAPHTKRARLAIQEKVKPASPHRKLPKIEPHVLQPCRTMLLR